MLQCLQTMVPPSSTRANSSSKELLLNAQASAVDHPAAGPAARGDACKAAQPARGATLQAASEPQPASQPGAAGNGEEVRCCNNAGVHAVPVHNRESFAEVRQSPGVQTRLLSGIGCQCAFAKGCIDLSEEGDMAVKECPLG